MSHHRRSGPESPPNQLAYYTVTTPSLHLGLCLSWLSCNALGDGAGEANGGRLAGAAALRSSPLWLVGPRGTPSRQELTRSGGAEASRSTQSGGVMTVPRASRRGLLVGGGRAGEAC